MVPNRRLQVVSHLISNALKYGEGKPVTVSVRADLKTDIAFISVRDHGSGILPEMQERIFERFERCISGTYISGLGLGLYIAKQILIELGGDISVVSDRNGSTFLITLPTHNTIAPKVAS